MTRVTVDVHLAGAQSTRDEHPTNDQSRHCTNKDDSVYKLENIMVESHAHASNAHCSQPAGTKSVPKSVRFNAVGLELQPDEPQCSGAIIETEQLPTTVADGQWRTYETSV